jgi:hypothetical protein
MGSFPDVFASRVRTVFPFRPWVRRAGLSIIVVALAVTAVILGGAALHPAFRFGWAREPFAWAYIAALWLGGAKVFLGTLRPMAEVDDERLLLRPLHQMRGTRIRWEAILGTEQMIGGDRLIVYHRTWRGMRFVAVNLNLVKGRRDFLALLDQRLIALGFTERVMERSRYLSKKENV